MHISHLFHSAELSLVLFQSLAAAHLSFLTWESRAAGCRYSLAISKALTVADNTFSTDRHMVLVLTTLRAD